MRALLPFRIVSILVLSVMGGSLQAQSIEEIKTWSEEEFAQKLTDQMAPRVPLKPEQVDPVHKINLKFVRQVLPLVKGVEDPKSNLNEIKRIDGQRSKELEIFLNPEQMRQVRQIQAENRKKMKQRYVEKNL